MWLWRRRGSKFFIKLKLKQTQLTKSTSVRLEEEKKGKLTQEEILAKLKDDKFKGKPVRLDGKPITEIQLKNVTENKNKKQDEEIYDPRKNRIQMGVVICNFNFRKIVV